MKKFLFLLSVYFLFNYNSFGCSCDTVSFSEATEWADEIFFGRVIQVKEVETGKNFEGEPYTKVWSALFEVEKKWKGSSKKYVEVFQAGTSCEFAFSFHNQPYIVYAKNSELLFWDSEDTFQGLTTWLCNRSASARTYNYWGEEEDVFNDRPRLDEKYPNPVKLSSINIDWTWIGVLFMTLLIGVLMGAALKKYVA